MTRALADSRELEIFRWHTRCKTYVPKGETKMGNQVKPGQDDLRQNPGQKTPGMDKDDRSGHGQRRTDDK